MDRDFQNRKFTELRFEYYSSGRTLWFTDTMSIGAMLLGYAVELSLKQLLIGSGFSEPKLLHSHIIPDLFAKCRERGCVPGVEASDDLLIYVSDMFNQRYPSQVTKITIAAQERGHSIGQSLALIPAYDDLMIQLDDVLRNNRSDGSLSIGLLAAHFVNRPQGRAFFHSNVAALKNTKVYREHLEKVYLEYKAIAESGKDGLSDTTVAYNLGLHRERLDSWAGAPDSLWMYKKMATCLTGPFDQLTSTAFAREFVYPGQHFAGA